ncbi:MAG: potassium channel protein [Spirochaetales bacterium]|nr:potassium channel protein [Spirochaetales bacterium]
MSPTVRFAIALTLVFLIVAGGTAGYFFIEKWSLSDSVYMTFLTITTVGFSEVHPLSSAGRHFTILLIMFSVFTLGYSVTLLVTYVFEGQIMKTVKERRMARATRKLKDHYIVCGAGRVGREVITEFEQARVKFVVIEKDPASSFLSQDESVLYIDGDASEDHVLKEAGIDTATGLVAALPDDESNLFVVFTARQMNPKLNIVARATDERTAKKLKKAGANWVISPIQIAGQRMASVMLRPSVVSFLDIIVGSLNMDMRMEQVPIVAGSHLIGKTLRESGIGERTGAIVVGINDASNRTKVNSASNTSLSKIGLKENDVLIALGSDEQLKQLQEFVLSK